MCKNLKFLLAAPLLCLAAGMMSGCDNADADVVLRILNAEDYIYEYEEGDEEEMETADDETTNAYKMDMLDQFVAYWEALPENSGKHLEIVYDTYDTNETMFNELKTGKTSYDVIIPSDYMVQKLATLGMLHKIEDDKKEDLWANISPYLRSSLETVKIGNTGYDDTDYCIPYMWGTLGIMYNPQYYIDNCGFEDADAVHTFFSTWDSLYEDDSTGTFSIKDSVRDTSTICAIHAYKNQLRDGSMTLDEIMNPLDENSMIKPEWLETVKNDMLLLKENSFGFETDSGKTDMTTQKIGANLCWSGDAAWAIYEAAEGGLDLYYSLPIGDPLNAGSESDSLSGSNIWFDCFCMPDNGEDGQYELAEQFIEFMSEPINAQQNCYCVGYTPSVTGDEMVDYIQSMYDVRYELEQSEIDELVLDEDYVEYDLSYFFTAETISDPDNAILWVDPDTAMRDLRAQYPRIEDLGRLGIMQDFGPGNQALLDMWETVRTNPLPVWAIVVFAIEGAAALGLIGFFVAKKVVRKKLKEERK